MLKRSRYLLLIVIMLVFSVSAFADQFETPSWWTGYNEDLPKYEVKPGFPHYAEHARYIGELSGTWEEMGIQYGERAGDLMRMVFDGYYEQQYDSVGDHELILTNARKFVEYLEMYCPEVVEFMRGMAIGADEELQKSYYQNGESFDKVVMINHYFAIRRSIRTMWNPGMEVLPPQQGEILIGSTCQLNELEPVEDAACSGMVVIGSLDGPTKDRTTIHSGTKDQAFFPQMYQVTYVANPSDPNGHKFWTVSSAGEVGGQMAGNDKGLTVSGYAGPSEGMVAFGLEWNIGDWVAAALAANVEEAVELLTIGRESYREASGYNIVIPAWGINWLISDPKDAAVVEIIPGRYAVRRPGDLGEDGFIVCTNHAMADHTYDENNQLTDVPMAPFGPYKSSGSYAGIISSGGRYWTLWWQIKRNWGNIDADMVMNWYQQHYFIDEEGFRHDYAYQESTGEYIRVSDHPLRYSLCRHIGQSATNTDAKVSVAQDLAFYFTNGRPGEWVGPWDVITLKYSNFR